MRTSWLTLLFGILIGLLAAAVILLVARPPHGQAIQLDPPPTPAPVVVSVTGQVANPGLYYFQAGSRVQDAIQAAGGLLDEADPQAVNLAAPIADGQQIYVAKTGEAGQPGQTSASTPPQYSPDHPLDLNQATLEELDQLPGIGVEKAGNILDYRRQHGPFQSIEDLLSVPGIGEGILDQIRDLVRVTGS